MNIRLSACRSDCPVCFHPRIVDAVNRAVAFAERLRRARAVRKLAKAARP